jgi:hypothetical protein
MKMLSRRLSLAITPYSGQNTLFKVVISLCVYRVRAENFRYVRQDLATT